MFPPFPAWEHAHPIIVHLPLGVLAAAPALVLIAMLTGKTRQAFAVAALVVLAIGTLGTMLATASGEAASDAVSIPARAVKVWERHEELAEMSRNVFLALTMGYAGIVGVGAAMKERFKRWAWIGAHVVILVALTGGLALLANAGHEGGRLVHEFGVRAHIVGAPAAGTPAPSDTREREGE